MDRATQRIRIIVCSVVLLTLGLCMKQAVPSIRPHMQSVTYQVGKVSTELEAYILSLYKRPF